VGRSRIKTTTHNMELHGSLSAWDGAG